MIDRKVVPLVRPARVIDRWITLTVFPNEYAKTKREVSIRFRDLPDAMAKRVKASKAELPYLKLAAFGDESSAKGCYRTNVNMLAIDGIEVEHDAGTMSLDDAIELARQARLAAIFYTTPSHTPAEPRWRVLIPTSRTATPRTARAACRASAGGF